MKMRKLINIPFILELTYYENEDLKYSHLKLEVLFIGISVKVWEGVFTNKISIELEFGI